MLTSSASTEVSDKLGTRNCRKRALVRSVSLPQTPTNCYHAKLSVVSLYYNAVKTSQHCIILLKKRIFPVLSEVIFNSTHTKTQKQSAAASASKFIF